MTPYFITALFGAWFVALVATPLVRRVARRVGFVDRPDGTRKVQRQAVALGGGIAVLLGCGGVASAVLLWAVSASAIPFEGQTTFFLSLLVAALLLAALGLADDAFGIRGRYKLAGQVLICLLLILCGLHVPGITVLGLRMDWGWWGAPFTLFWLIGIINAVNLLDGADGLASSLGVLLALTIAFLAVASNHPGNAMLMVALAGALLGFLPYNRAPASIYLGDTGSMLIGLLLGAVTINGGLKTNASLAFLVPLCALAVPILDSTAALLRRRLTGRSLFAADRGHFHHVLMQKGYTVTQAVLLIDAVCAITCAGAVIGFYFRREFLAVLIVTLVLFALAAGKIFGHVELRLIVHRLAAVARRLLPRRNRTAEGVLERALHLQGSRQWDLLWAGMRESAAKYKLTRLELTISIPSLAELFHASWARPNGAAPEDQWRSEVPLHVDGRPVGQLIVVGDATRSHATLLQMRAAMDFLEPLEGQIQDVLDAGQVVLEEVISAAAAAERKHSSHQGNGHYPYLRQRDSRPRKPVK